MMEGSEEAAASTPPPPPTSDDMSSDHGHDPESQPFLSDASSLSEAQQYSEKSHHHRRSRTTLFLWLVPTIITVFALAGIAFSIQPPQRHNVLSPPVHKPPHQESYIQYKEDIPNTPQLRPNSEYILSPPSEWNLDAKSVTREYNWTIRDADFNPDGIFRPMMLINNQYPGPLIECNEGDTLIVHVKNEAVNATSIHFHGMYQNGTNDMDGVVGVTQCAIAPKSSFTYKFTIREQSGTYWYHAHHSLQASDGLLGPMVVHSSDERTLQELDYSTDRIVMVGDHYHNTTSELLMDYLRPRNENDEPVPDNALINGRSIRDCKDFPGWRCNTEDRSAPVFDLEPGLRHRLRFINVGAFAEFQIEIDEHPFSITEVDGTDVHPESFHRLNILPGQRYSMVLETNVTQSSSAKDTTPSSPPTFWLRTKMITHCFTTENPLLQSETRAIIRYASPSTSSSDLQTIDSAPEPASKEWSEAIEVICRDLDTTLLRPVIPINPPPATDQITLRANFMIGDWKLDRGFFNDSTWHINATSPSLHRFLDTNSSASSSSSSSPSLSINTHPFHPSTDLILQTTSIRTLDITINSFDDGAHPFHLHGHKFSILAQNRTGYPPLPHEIPAYLDANPHLLENPLRRDVVTVEGYAWVLIRVTLDNPGLWAFHCHNAWHAAAGMVMQFLVRGKEVSQWEVDEEHRDMCRREGVTRGMRPDDSIWFGDFS